MKKFLINTILFIIPYCILIILSVIVMFYSSEIFSIDKVINYQHSTDKPTLIGCAYSYMIKYYKLQNTLLRKPDIISMGSSRVLQIRKKFFKKDFIFYNIGGAVNMIRFFRLFFNELKNEKLPTIIIIGMDQWWFNYKVDDLTTNQFDRDLKKPSNDFKTILYSWHNVYIDFFKGKIDLQKLFETNNDGVVKFGLSAIMQNHGFRNDGSYYYGHFNYKNTPIQNMQGELNMFKNKSSWFTPCANINDDAVKELESFLNQCQEKNVKVIGFLPPYSNLLYSKMLNKKENFPNVFELENKLKPIFENSGFELYNFSDPKSILLSDNEFIDGTHASEKAYLKLFISMLEKSETLRNYADIEFLKDKLKNTKSNIEVFGYEN